MNKIILFYWAQGSCGDIIKNLLNSDEYSFELSQNGRSLPAIDRKLADLFTWDTDTLWYSRQWTESECYQLIDYQQKEKKSSFTKIFYILECSTMRISPFIKGLLCISSIALTAD